MSASSPVSTDIADDHVSVLNKDIVLVLNAQWIVTSITSPRRAMVSLAGGDKDHPVLALDIELDEQGRLLAANPVSFEDWMLLPVRENDLYLQTAKSRVRCPTVVIAKNFNKTVMKRPRLSSQTIYERDGGRCQYTGRPLTRKQASLDHVVPRSRGGRDSFENIVLADRDVNTAKADRTPEEAGLKLLRKPKAPASTPMSATIRDARRPEWVPFLLK